jgi:hypothetical protein
MSKRLSWASTIIVLAALGFSNAINFKLKSDVEEISALHSEYQKSMNSYVDFIRNKYDSLATLSDSLHEKVVDLKGDNLFYLNHINRQNEIIGNAVTRNYVLNQYALALEDKLDSSFMYMENATSYIDFLEMRQDTWAFEQDQVLVRKDAQIDSLSASRRHLLLDFIDVQQERDSLKRVLYGVEEY